MSQNTSVLAMGIAATVARDVSWGIARLLMAFGLLALLFAVLSQPVVADEPAVATAARVGGDDIRTRFVPIFPDP